MCALLSKKSASEYAPTIAPERKFHNAQCLATRGKNARKLKRRKLKRKVIWCRSSSKAVILSLPTYGGESSLNLASAYISYDCNGPIPIIAANCKGGARDSWITDPGWISNRKCTTWPQRKQQGDNRGVERGLRNSEGDLC